MIIFRNIMGTNNQNKLVKQIAIVLTVVVVLGAIGYAARCYTSCSTKETVSSYNTTPKDSCCLTKHKNN